MKSTVSRPSSARRPRVVQHQQRPQRRRSVSEPSPDPPRVAPAPAEASSSRLVVGTTATRARMSASPLSERPRRSQTNPYYDSPVEEAAPPGRVPPAQPHLHAQHGERGGNSGNQEGSLLSYYQGQLLANGTTGRQARIDTSAPSPSSALLTLPRPPMSPQPSSSRARSGSSSLPYREPLPAAASVPLGDSSWTGARLLPPRHRETDEDDPYFPAPSHPGTVYPSPPPLAQGVNPATATTERQPRRPRDTVAVVGEGGEGEDRTATVAAGAASTTREAILGRMDDIIAAQAQRTAWQLASYRQSAELAQTGWAAIRAAVTEFTEDEECEDLLPTDVASFLVKRRYDQSPPQRQPGSGRATTAVSERELALQAEVQACQAELAALRAATSTASQYCDAAEGKHTSLDAEGSRLDLIVQARVVEQLRAMLAESYEQSLLWQRALEEERSAHMQTRLRLWRRGAPAARQVPSSTPPSAFVGLNDTLDTARRVLSSSRVDAAAHPSSPLSLYDKLGSEQDEDDDSNRGEGASGLRYEPARGPTSHADAVPTSCLSVSEADVWNMTREVLAKYAGKSY